MTKKLKIVVLLETSRAYDRDLLGGITDFNKLHDKFEFFFFSPKYIHQEDHGRIIKRVISWKPDGILTREIGGFKSLLKLRVPLLIFPHTALYKDQINVWGENAAIGQMAAGYFISKGYKNFAFFGFKSFQWSIERQNGFIDTVEAAGFGVKNFIFDNATLLWENLPVRLGKWLSCLQTPCAIFSATDELNIHLVEAAKKCDLRVPDDLSIIGVDNDELVCEMSSPTLSSIDHNARLAGFQAASTLYRWIEFGEKPTANIIAKAGAIVSRNSTNALSIDDLQVRMALYYISNTAPSRDITVNDVVKATTLSRRILEKRFQVAIKSSILAEIKKVRIERIKYLLTHSQMTVQEIALELNFRNFDNITRYFKQYTGVKPLEYRSKLKA